MATIVAHSIGTAGDYTSISAWLSSVSARGTDLTSRNVIEQGRITGTMTERILISSSTFTTSSDCYLELTADTDQSHAGVWDDAAATVYLNCSAGAHVISSSYIHFSKLQLAFNYSSNSQTGCSAGLSYYNYCLVKAINSGGYTGVKGIIFGSNNPAYLACCILYDFSTTSSRAIFIDNYSATSPIFYNCTFVNCYYGINKGAGAAPIAKNCLAQGCTDGFYGTFSSSSDHNCSDISGDAPGTNAVTGTVTFVDAANDDYHLASSDTVANGAGADLSSDSLYPFSVDIDGDTITAWSIGADAQVATSSSAMTITGDVSWRVLASLATQSAWGIQGKTQGASSWPIFVRLSSYSAWSDMTIDKNDSDWKILVSLSRNTSWKNFSEIDQSTSWRSMTRSAIDSAWAILGAEGITQDISWKVLSNKYKDIAWKVFSEKASVSSWSISNRSRHDSIWGILAKVMSVSEWDVFSKNSGQTSWDIFNRQQKICGWSVLSKSQKDTGWKLFSINDNTISWRVLSAMQKYAEWRLLAVISGHLSWDVISDFIVITPTARIISIGAESRVLPVTSESRLVAVSNESRTIIVLS